MTVDPLGYGATSFWLETCDDDLTPRPGLDGSADADVAILGAGYTGLWTAYELLRREPGDSRLTVLEREIAGFGASGRNGGWCARGPAGCRRPPRAALGRAGDDRHRVHASVD